MANKDREKYNEYMRDYILRRYHRRMAGARALLGGKCAKCGSLVSLELDHIDPNSKWDTISRIWSYSEKRFLEELNKCQLLCEECHKSKTLQDLGQISAKGAHGTLSSRKYCGCSECVAAKTAYMREYKRKRKQTS